MSIDHIAKFLYDFVIKQEGVFMPTIKSSADLRNLFLQVPSIFPIYIFLKFRAQNLRLNRSHANKIHWCLKFLECSGWNFLIGCMGQAPDLFHEIPYKVRTCRSLQYMEKYF